MNINKIIKQAEAKGIRVTARFSQIYVTDNTLTRSWGVKIFNNIGELKRFIDAQ